MSRTPQRPSGSAPIERSGLMTRRDAALKAMLGITAVTAGLVSSPLRAIAVEASRETTNALNSAQAQLDEAQRKLDAISDEYVSLNEQLINDVKRAKAELDSQKAQLESQKSDLEQLKEQQSQELAAVQAKQDEASSIVANLSDDVRALMEKRDAEILAAAEEEKRQAAAAEAARKAAAAASSNRGSSGVSGTVSSGNASSKGQAIVNACYRVGSPGSGLCAMWVSQVYNAAGYGYSGGNANNMYWNFCTSSNKGDLQPGMIVAVSTWTGTSAGRVYGHVGIYIGGGMVMHNVGSIQTMGLDTWINTYGTTVTPRWGWAA